MFIFLAHFGHSLSLGSDNKAKNAIQVKKNPTNNQNTMLLFLDPAIIGIAIDTTTMDIKYNTITASMFLPHLYKSMFPTKTLTQPAD